MKGLTKKLITLFFLLLIAVALWVYGWVELRIPNGSTAILVSKTSGIDTNLFSSSGHSWRWQLLIPRNATLYIMNPRPYTKTINITLSLPSAKLYARYAEGSPPFTIKLTAKISHSLPLTPSYFIQSKTVPTETQLKTLHEAFMTKISNIFKKIMLQPQIKNSLTLLSLVKAQIQTENLSAPSQYSIEIISLDIPDYDVYKAAKNAYFDIQRSIVAALKETKTDEALLKKRRDDKLEMIKEYAQLLEDHPVLLEYLSKTSQDPAALFQQR